MVAWDAPPRGDRAVGFAEAWRRLRWHTAIGIGLVLALGLARPAALAWAWPFLLGLVLAVPAAVCSGSVRLGEWARRLGLFLTEDELAPSAELAALTAFEHPDQESQSTVSWRWRAPRRRLPALLHEPAGD